ncbi:phosphotransferase enzyme family protein [Paenibacillus apii]|uniref:phosphotransferase enzyme family protein n=1 Tax=Paenibacillus apii TaxID=1850370 RepID=UPI00143B4D7A|nr:phosphotransferase [Paenibacillus apii]NJJ39143.1 phosphotransferase [Paenibacillus apii]
MNHLLTAAEALKSYAIHVDTIQLIGQSGNIVYKVTDSDQHTYSLHLNKSKNDALDSKWTSYEALKSQLQWVDALAAETDLVVPISRKNTDGEHITIINGVLCTLTSWLEGENKSYIPTKEDAENTGTMIAKIHKHSSGWKTPDGFSRPAYDSSAIASVLEQLDQASEFSFNQKTLRVLKEAGNKLIRFLDSQDKRNGKWGMIHADLICPNILFYNQEVRPIDFGACGFGFYLRDIALLFAYTPLELREAVLEAYSKCFPLPDNYVKLTEAFFVAAQMESLNFLLRVPEASEWVPTTFDKLTDREFASFLMDEHFLFSGVPFWC